MTTIPLDRRFFEWRDDGHSDPDSFRRWMRSSHLLSWDDVVARRRVVLLAEAGSGKTEEMREQARLRSAASQFAVYATVEDVGREGLEQALGASDRARLAAWRNTDDKGWFFVDSVDEARLGQVRFDRALRQIANGIFGTERRAHIVLSCRATDWGAARDLERLTEVLPIPRDAPAPPSSPDQLLVRVLHAKKPEAATVSVEAPLVVLMEPLDRERTECFCAAKCVPDLGSFVEEIEARNLWQFARRPLDLDWLIDFWREHRRLGSLAEMLETSLSARVLEPNPDRARADDLDPARALRALERIGGALVLGRRRTIATLDSDLLRSDDDRPLDLPQVLTDWTPQDCIRLLNRPVFDPATYGRARLHNDNENVVRAYLAARWLHRLRTENLSKGELFGLLFATSYGVVLVKPSMQETAAWLALWDEDVGREVARRMPELLMTAGDPASLPAPVREAAFSDVLARITTGTCRLPPFAEDSLKRFAQPDLGAALRRLWPLYKHDAEARRVMLQLIWLGALSDCANLAAEVAFDKDAEEYGRATAGRAIITAGDDGLKRRYADFVVENCGALPLMVVTDALDGLFPTRIGVGDLLKILGEIDVGHSQGASSVEREAPGWFDRLNDRAEIERLLAGLLMQLGPESADVGRIPDAREEAYLSGIAAAASRLLQFCNPDELPGDTVEAALRVGRADRYGHSTLHERRDIAPELQRTIKRRHLAFWRIVERRKGRDWLGGRPIEHIDQMALFGYAPHLGEEDLDWLLADVKTRTIESERRLAIATALGVWRDAGTRAKAILARIREVASGDAMLTAIVQYWLHPPKPSPAYRAQERRYKALHKKHEAERAERDRSWVEFVERLRKNPGELRALAPPTPQGADSRLYHLWMFLCDAMDTNGRSAIDSIAPVEPMLGSEVAIEVRDALIRFWREWTPTSKSQRASGQRNSYSALDCMGITGVSLEAATRPRWAQHLSHAEARQAAVYGTIELSGFPAWFEALGDAQPTAVREVLSCELLAELADPEPRVRYDVFEDTARAGAGTTALVAP
ncbi:MAG TPA: hypothetical protein VHW66_15405, partial [Stellaceae bacterium]|nr:hypothetical protein [Stellaceae bacterium]